MKRSSAGGGLTPLPGLVIVMVEEGVPEVEGLQAKLDNTFAEDQATGNTDLVIKSVLQHLLQIPTRSWGYWSLNVCPFSSLSLEPLKLILRKLFNFWENILILLQRNKVPSVIKCWIIEALVKEKELFQYLDGWGSITHHCIAVFLVLAMKNFPDYEMCFEGNNV